MLTTPARLRTKTNAAKETVTGLRLVFADEDMAASGKRIPRTAGPRRAKPGSASSWRSASRSTQPCHVSPTPLRRKWAVRDQLAQAAVLLIGSLDQEGLAQRHTGVGGQERRPQHGVLDVAATHLV